MSSSRWDRFEEAEELDTSEEPLLRREPVMERMDLESASSNLGSNRPVQQLVRIGSNTQLGGGTTHLPRNIKGEH